jgi:hypothetical protein
MVNCPRRECCALWCWHLAGGSGSGGGGVRPLRGGVYDAEFSLNSQSMDLTNAEVVEVSERHHSVFALLPLAWTQPAHSHNRKALPGADQTSPPYLWRAWSVAREMQHGRGARVHGINFPTFAPSSHHDLTYSTSTGVVRRYRGGRRRGALKPWAR